MQADSSLVSQVIPNGNAFAGRNGLRPSYIILHGTAGGTSAEAIARYFQSTQGGSNPVSAHYVIGTDGTIVQCNSEQDGAWANGYVSTGHDPWWSETNSPNPNNITISIEHCKPDASNDSAPTPAQQDSSFRLIADICQRRGIPARDADANGGITGHFSIDPVNRQHCPGTYPWDQLWAFLNNQQQGGGDTNDMTMQITDPFASQYFVEVAPNRWHCTATNQDIAYAILAFYKYINGAPKLPLTGEIPVPGSTNGATYQIFQGGIIGYHIDAIQEPATQSGCSLVSLQYFMDKLQAQFGTHAVTTQLTPEAKADFLQVFTFASQIESITGKYK